MASTLKTSSEIQIRCRLEGKCRDADETWSLAAGFLNNIGNLKKKAETGRMEEGNLHFRGQINIPEPHMQ